MESKTHESTRLSKLGVPFAETGFFSKVILDYLHDDSAIRPFYNRRPVPESFEAQMSEKAASYSHREALVDALAEQYKLAKLKSGSIEKLRDNSTFTITTGHQVCLFTGPLYFIYKIISAVRTCEVLSSKYPTNSFIPVFWMATEDHDFEEANHFYLPSGKIAWESGQGGAVGRMTPDGMEEVLEELRTHIGVGFQSGELIALFEKAYIKHPNIADATRCIVHQLFGHMGVVVIDGDDRALKSLAVPMFKQELLESLSEKAVAKSSDRLSRHYSLQVHARDINLFYLGDQLRARIVRAADGGFEVLQTPLKFADSELLSLLETEPEKFSPNVILRGLYQEAILPNLAYIGGGGELAYWFQLKDMFAAFNVPFPILMLRNSALFVDADSAELTRKLEFSLQDLFAPALQLENAIARKGAGQALNLEGSREKLEAVFLEIESRLRSIDPTLERSVKSGFVRTNHVLENLEKKMLRAERKKQEVDIARLHKLRNVLFPREGLQERNMHFTPLYEALGPSFIDQIAPMFDPFAQEFVLLVAQK